MSGAIRIGFGGESFQVDGPGSLISRGMKPMSPLEDPEKAILTSLASPIGSEPLLSIAREKIQSNPGARAVVVISDSTRPVPYRGRKGILHPVLDILGEAGFRDESVLVLIGSGSHRKMSGREIEEMLGLAEAGRRIRVEDHDYEDDDNLVYLGVTKRGSRVRINKSYMEADLKIVTGLVESHFMAGASGGRKGICPALVAKETLYIFHGPELLGSDKAADLVIEGNPCSEESLEIARMASCDFIVNVTLDGDKRITGVFSGDLEKAHTAAVEKIRSYVTVDVDRLYDIVLIPAGYVGVNHYQTAKAAVEASRVVKTGGVIVVVAENTDPDPVGGTGYRKCLSLLKKLGKDEFMKLIRSNEWELVPEQWQVQMWCKVFDVVQEENNFIYCSLDIPDEEYAEIPGKPGIEFITENERNTLDRKECMRLMVRRALEHAQGRFSDKPDILFLEDGPYGIPSLMKET